MPIEVKSGATTDALTIDPVSKAARTTLYKDSGVLFGTASDPISVNATSSSKVVGSVGTYMASSFRIAGVAVTSQNLCTIRNNSGAKAIAIRRIAVDVSYSAAATDLIMGYFRLWPNTGVTPSGGAAATKHKFDSAYPSSQAETEILFASSADGVAAAITHALPGSSPAREQARASILTAVGETPGTDYELLTHTQEPIIVNPGETLLIAVVSNAVDVVTRHYTVKLVWEEYA